MSKPDWKDAPDWANWLAQEADGQWWWFEHPVEWCSDGWAWVNTSQQGRFRKVGDPPDCQDTLESRPQKASEANAVSTGATNG